jgi:hypothetical protein
MSEPDWGPTRYTEQEDSSPRPLTFAGLCVKHQFILLPIDGFVPGRSRVWRAEPLYKKISDTKAIRVKQGTKVDVAPGTFVIEVE